MEKVDDKNLAMVCVTLLAIACLGVEVYAGTPISSNTGNVVSMVVTGLMGAAVGRAMAK